MMPMTPAGALSISGISSRNSFGHFATRLQRKIHLQVDRLFIMPPKIGPRNGKSTKTTETRLVHDADFSGGTRSKKMGMHMAYIPEPTMP